MTKDQAITKLIEACKVLRQVYKTNSRAPLRESASVYHVVNALDDALFAIDAPRPQESERELMNMGELLARAASRENTMRAALEWIADEAVTMSGAKQYARNAIKTSTAPAEISYTVAGTVARGVQEPDISYGRRAFGTALPAETDATDASEIARLRADLAEACGLLKEWRDLHGENPELFARTDAFVAKHNAKGAA